MGHLLRSSLAEAARGCPYLRPPHGLGMMLGLTVIDSAGVPDAARCDLYLERLKDRGVLAGKTGPDRNVLTFMPPLILQPDEARVLCDATSDAIVGSA